jgi:hypothetical protein
VGPEAAASGMGVLLGRFASPGRGGRLPCTNLNKQQAIFITTQSGAATAIETTIAVIQKQAAS